MRSFAMERASGTYESLMTAPIGDWQVVLSKFTGALIFYAILWLPLLVCSMVVRFYVGESAVLGLGTMFTSALGVLLAAVAEIDVGRLLVAGFLPGFVLAALYAGMIMLQLVTNPGSAPAYDVPYMSPWTKIRLVRKLL